MPNFAITTEQLTRRFGSVTAVDHLDLQIDKATIYGFLGPNGSGKSTTIRMLCGLLTPTHGQVEVMGFHLPKQAEALKRKIGYMTQKFSLYSDLSAIENLNFIGQIYELPRRQLKQRIAELLNTYALTKIAKQQAGSMSGGQRQRLALAAATLHKPPLLFLDEPTSAVDPENRRDFWEKLFDLCDSGTTILVSTHYMDEAERCHKLAILEAGQLKADGTPQQLMDNMGVNVIEITADNLRTLKNQILQLPKIRSVAQQGIRLRVLVERSIDDPCQYLQTALDKQAAHYQITRPSLEDVFVSVTKRTAS